MVWYGVVWYELIVENQPVVYVCICVWVCQSESERESSDEDTQPKSRVLNSDSKHSMEKMHHQSARQNTYYTYLFISLRPDAAPAYRSGQTQAQPCTASYPHPNVTSAWTEPRKSLFVCALLFRRYAGPMLWFVGYWMFLVFGLTESRCTAPARCLGSCLARRGRLCVALGSGFAHGRLVNCFLARESVC